MTRFRLAIAACAALFVAATPLHVQAQGVAGSFEQLRVLVKSGDTLTVRDASGSEVTGKLDSLTPSSLTLVTEGRPREFSEADVSRIRQRRGDSLANGALIGAATGAGFFGLLAAGLCDDDCAAGGTIAATGVWAAMGAGVGVGVDALIRWRHVVYEKRATSADLAVMPILGGGRRGAALSVAF